MIPSLLCLSLASQAGASCTEDAMIVFDASGSMAEMGYNGLDEPRIIEARVAMHTVLPDVAPLRRLGLVTYGPGENSYCENVKLRMPPQADAAGPILQVVDTIEPSGNTALTDAVRDASEVLGGGQVPGTVVLITDGKETCGGAPCQLAAQLAGTGITVHVIGFRVRADFFNWEGGDAAPEIDRVPTVARCLADATEGVYVSAESLDELITALRQTLGCNFFSALPQTRAQRGPIQR
ncbi:vWA domain-containing protein [Primorskyibacter sp. S187A]|uniref:vWA domain-containing protein n=1 Tax=Primorskyibacter sp. S187A TaxID=3415130 RepID=UPI003C7AA3DE